MLNSTLCLNFLTSNWQTQKKNNLLIPQFISVDGIGDINARKIIQARNLRPFLPIEDFQTRTKTNNITLKKLI
ncbi:hypothetical protein [Mesomycoplasma ovipneumoniae]|uniref:helix-hairpin-helix domain-containing protein n=1 Tax=Mesomycoplasma ovipneumoniae TaxID=29562 RepID=UPI00307FE471